MHLRRLTLSTVPRTPVPLLSPLATSPIKGNIGEVVLKILTELQAVWVAGCSSYSFKAGPAPRAGRPAWEGEHKGRIAMGPLHLSSELRPAGVQLGAERTPKAGNHGPYPREAEPALCGLDAGV